MARIVWDAPGKRYYETGVDRGVLYPPSGKGVAWNGLRSVDVKPTGGTATGYYIDGEKYLNVAADSVELTGTIKAFTYPDEFAVCEGTHRVHAGLFVTEQPPKPFGLSFRTTIGNDLLATAYKIHLLYNVLATPSSRSYTTMSDRAEPIDLSWDISTRPTTMTGVRRSAHVEIDTRYANPQAVADLEDLLYGTPSQTAALPTFAQLNTLFESYATMSVTDNGDGTFTVIAPPTILTMLDASTFQISWDSATPIDADTYTLSSL